jgi:nucleotide-binding universal stress UspA family protein
VPSSCVAPVVAGVDGSASSLSAVRLAAGHAALYGCPLLIVHAFNWLPRQRLPAGTCPRAAADDVIGRAAAAAGEVAPGLEIGTRLLEGAATSALLRLARTAVLLAVGDGGLSAQDCLPTYASAVHIAARAPCSVLVARASSPSHGPILVGVNGAPASEQALDAAFDIAARRRAELVVVRAAPSSPDGRAGDDEQLRDLADLVRPRQDRYHVAARIRLLPGEPEAVLVAASAGAGLVIVGARGRRPYQGLLGPVAQTLLQHSPAPVVLVRGGTPVPARGPEPRPPATFHRATRPFG